MEPTILSAGEFAITIDATASEASVWFRVRQGCMSGGQFMSTAQARALAAALNAHADIAEAAQKVAA